MHHGRRHDRAVRPMLLLLLLLLGRDSASAWLSRGGPSRTASRRNVATEPTRIVADLLVEKKEKEAPRSSLPTNNQNHDDEDPNNDEDDEDRPHRLDLDSDGTLRMGPGGPALLEGLDPSVWAAVPREEGRRTTTDAVFLKATHHGAPSAEHELSLGRPGPSWSRWLAGARLNRYWMGPAFGGDSVAELPTDTQFLLVELGGGGDEAPSYALLLPMVDAGFRATLGAAPDDPDQLGVVCHSEFGDATTTVAGHDGTMLALCVVVGGDPFALLAEGFRAVADRTQTFQVLSDKAVPDSVDGFGWCTWDAFYSGVTPSGILEGVKALSHEGVPPRSVILDDGWQVVHPEPKAWVQEEDDDDDDQQSSSPNFLSRWLVGPLVDRVARAATDYYTAKVEGASHGSLHHRTWTFLARTVLKGGLWDFFDSTTDFARQLNGFSPNSKFENPNNNNNGVGSLGELVSVLKGDLGVKHVYCWHAIHGYWRGISTSLGESIGIDVTQVQPRPTSHTLSVEPQAAFDPPSLFGVGVVQRKDDLATLYQHLHAPLAAAGVDGVKVDVQSGVTAAGSGIGDGSRIAQLYTEAMEASVAKNFPASGSHHHHRSNNNNDEDNEDTTTTNGAVHVINCMCHSTENLYRYRTTAVARASEDFFPDKPESHSVHLVNVAYNSLFLGEICLPDWDMFHSKHESAALHAAARAIGGCPVYVSDVPGEHDPALLRKLVLPDGSILRSVLPGRPTRDCLFADVGRDGTTALKIWNQHKAGGGGVVGAFHVQGVAWDFCSHRNEVLVEQPQPLTASVQPSDVELLRDHNHNGGGSRHRDGYAVWKHRSQSLHLLQDDAETIETPLEHREWEIHTIVPVQSTDTVRWAPIGLGEMMNSGGALESAGPLEQSTASGRRSTTVGFGTRGPGRFVAYCQPAPSSIMINDSEPGSLSSRMEDFTHDHETGLLSFELPPEANHVPHQITVVWDH